MKTNYLLLIWLLLAGLFAGCYKEDADTAPAGKYADELSSSTSVIPPPSTGNGDNPMPGVLTAGEWNDLENWDFWKTLMQKKEANTLQQKWQFSLVNKYTVLLKDMDGKQISNARVSLETTAGISLAESRTDNSGTCVLFPKSVQAADELRLKIVYASQVFYMGIGDTDGPNGVFEKQLNVRRQNSNNLDIVFVVDATGSMGDEMAYLQTELKDVINRVKAKASNNLSIRLGSVFYRDQGDEYITKSFPLTGNITSLLGHINEQAAGGGGDFPEAVDVALEEAISAQNWRDEAISRIVFLVLDAPPHHSPPIVEKLHKLSAQAASKGIKLIPVTASGIDKETEFLMRSLAISTNGTYVFITDHSGIGNDHLEPTIGQYEVEYLNNLMVRLIVKYSESK